MKTLLGICLVLLTAAVVRADPPGELVEDIWEVAHLDGVRLGSVHTTVRAIESEGAKRYRATAELDLTFKRNGALMKLRMDQGTEETADGKVTAVFMRQDAGRQLNLQGTVSGEVLHVVVDQGRLDEKQRWSDQAVGQYQWQHLFEHKKPKPGDTFDFVRYESIVNHLVTMKVVVKEREEVAVLTKKQKLLRVEMTPDKIEAPGQSVQLPGVVWWLDDEFIPRRRQFEMDGLGTIVLTRTTRNLAALPVTASLLPDIGKRALIALNRTIARPYETRSAVYRITIRGDKNAASALPSDAHQETSAARGETFELRVHPARPAVATGAEDAPAAEFLNACPYINCDAPALKQLAQKAVGDETDPWKKALKLEKWVHANMQVDQTTAMAPAAQVARDLRGDCRNHALLLAGLCRAAGIPARIAVGLLYVEKGGQPRMGFHMWTEIYLDGRWLGLDAIVGQGGVSACHIKIADHSWKNVQSELPFLPVQRILGKTSIEIVSVGKN